MPFRKMQILDDSGNAWIMFSDKVKVWERVLVMAKKNMVNGF